jgi:nucleotide-binding universal stress UspA family protein
MSRLATTSSVDLGLELGAASGRGSAGVRRVIVVATSGSRASIEATMFAAEVAGVLSATLRIVHVVPPLEYHVGRFAPMRAVPRKLTDPFESPVLRHARELAWQRGAAATLQLLAGDPPQAIVSASTDAHADLLVIGVYHGARWHPAPTRRWVQAHAPCQVLTAAARGEAAWS